MPTEKEIQTIRLLLGSAEHCLQQAKALLAGSAASPGLVTLNSSDDGHIIEGMFDGETMIGSGDKHYPVPANYASKSKLVSGDILKLTILPDGTFVYKQLGPVKRKKVIGKLEMDAKGRYFVICAEGKYKVLAASVSYFKAEPGDTLTIILPEEVISEWAAVENLITVD